MSRMADYDAESDDIDRTSFKGRLREARKAKGLHQDELADRIKKSRATIAAYENGRATPDLDVIARLARELDYDPRYLAFGSGPGYEPMAREPGLTVDVMGRQGETEKELGKLTLPRPLCTALSLPEAGAKLVELDVDAPAFDLAKGQWLLLDGAVERIEPDGALYAIFHDSRVVVIRATPGLAKGESALSLVGGYGEHHRLNAEVIHCLGRVAARLGAV